MKNFLFITAGLTVVVLIVVATLVYERPPELAETPAEEPAPVVVPEPEPEPVFIPEEITSVKVFFSNSQEDPGAEVCEQVYSVEREIEPTPAVAKEALDQLLAGVTADEKVGGYFTNINTRARVVSVAIEQGVATVVFNEDFQTGMAGACKVTAVRAQIEETLKQFPTVQEVIIKVEGIPDEEVLQP
jgi:spore germination protein GerM